MNTYKFEFETDTKGLIELSVALAYSISLMQEKIIEDEDSKVVYGNAVDTVRNLLTFIHGIVDPNDKNNRCQNVRYFGDKQYRFF